MRKKLFLLTLLAFSLTMIFSIEAHAQPTNKNLPFGVGETLTYEGKFSKIIKGIAVADISLTVENAAKGDDFLIKGEAKSKGTLAKLFRFSFLQKIDSTVDDDNFRVLKTVKRDVQKERVRDSEAVFDYLERRVTYVETDPKSATRPPRRIASAIEATTHDLISGIYNLRLLPLAVGESFDLKISDSGLVYEIPVRVTRREQQKTIFGKIWCFRVEPEVFGDRRFIEREGSMIIWIADDSRRVPVRSQINTDLGRIEIKLKTAKGVKTIDAKTEKEAS